MVKMNIHQQSTLRMISGEKGQSVEIDGSIIDSGFLKKFPGSTLSIFMYLVTHFDKNNYFITTRVDEICSKIPYTKNEVQQGLDSLQNNDLIMINDQAYENDKFQIYINFEKVAHISEKDNDEKEQFAAEKESASRPKTEKKEYAEQSIKTGNNLQESGGQNPENLKHLKIIQKFIPENKDTTAEMQKIKKWLNDFDKKVIKELILRVKKWQKKNNKNTEQAYYYMNSIIEDWYEKESFSYEKLQHFDQMYRETRELAEIYGIDSWKNVDTVQMKTFKSWLTDDDFSLSLEVAKYAVKQAIIRKSDGQPSLKYIEDNYIRPWKNAEIRSVQEAKNYLARQDNRNFTHPKNNQNTQDKQKSSGSSQKNSSSRTASKKSSWNNFPWKLDKITQGGSP